MRQTGRHALEFPVVLIVLALICGALLRALDSTGDAAEEAAVRHEVAAIRADLLDRVAHHETVGGALPASHNPLRWIGRAPAAYAGEVDQAPSAGGLWYYDRSANELVYRFRSGRESRFRLARGGEAGGAQGALAGVALLGPEEER